MIDKNILEQLLERNLDSKLNKMFTECGLQLDIAHKLFRFISEVFKHIPPELISWKFRVIMPVGNNWDFSQNVILNLLKINDCFSSECTIVVVDNNLFVLESYNAEYPDHDYICYKYNATQNETLTVNGHSIQLTDYYDTTMCSIFARPTYKELDEAMDSYNSRYVKECSCGVLSQIWKDKNKRELIQKPERFMRDSLWQYLQNRLRNHTVKREQVVDATHPVDIKVTWPTISNVALIEVKWLGDSGQTKYRDARANEGAQQLIEYLTASAQEEPDKNFVGFLTVFDGRRGRICNQYEFQEINYNPEFVSHPYMRFRRFYMAESIV